MANARKYGRKLEDFEEIYNRITRKYGKEGKTCDEKEIIMNDILPNYVLEYEKVNEEQDLKQYWKKGIKCLASFGLNNKEWENFTNYFKGYISEEKILTKEILEKPIANVENPEEISRHDVVLKDIDEEGN